jgi:hypothetical protein
MVKEDQPTILLTREKIVDGQEVSGRPSRVRIHNSIRALLGDHSLYAFVFENGERAVILHQQGPLEVVSTRGELDENIYSRGDVWKFIALRHDEKIQFRLPEVWRVGRNNVREISVT